MASPQLENGYTRIAHEILEALAGTNLSGREYRLLLIILRKTFGWSKNEDKISLSQMSIVTGISKPHCSEVVASLEKKNIIRVTGFGYRGGKKYRFNKNFDQWVKVPIIGNGQREKVQQLPDSGIVNGQQLPDSGIVNGQQLPDSGIDQLPDIGTDPLPESGTTIETYSKETFQKKIIGKDALNGKGLSWKEFQETVKVDTEAKACIEHFLRKYKKLLRKEHPRLKETQWIDVLKTLFYYRDPKTKEFVCLLPYEINNMIDLYFQTKFQKNCNYSIIHFNAEGVKSNRALELLNLQTKGYGK